MKKKYIFLLAFLVSAMAFSQITFNDDNFKNALLTQNVVDTDDDGIADAPVPESTTDPGEIDQADAALITFLDVSGYDIVDFTGIEEFTGLEFLNASYNDATTVDLSALSALKNLRFSSNDLESIDLPTGTPNNLEYLYLGFNELTESTIGNINSCENLLTFSAPNNKISDINDSLALDVADFLNLLRLDVSQNELQDFDLSQNTELIEVNLHTNSIDGTYNFNDNSELKKLNLKNNELSSITIGNHPELTEIDFSNNSLTGTYNFSINPALMKISINQNSIIGVITDGLEFLEELYASNNNISAIDLTGNINLKKLGLTNNSLFNINLDDNIKLETIGISENNLNALTFLYADGEEYEFLHTIYADENQLSQVNVTKCIALKNLYLKDNQLQGASNLDLTENGFLEDLNLRDNFFENGYELDLTGNPLLRKLNLQGNNFTELEVGINTNLEELNLRGNDFVTVDLATNVNLKYLNLKSNELTSFDASDLTNLEYADLAFNELLELDFNNNTALTELYINDNNLFYALFIHNETQVYLGEDGDGLEGLSLIYLCANDYNLEYYQNLVELQNYVDCSVNDFCEYDPLASTYLLQGNVEYDFGAASCTTTNIQGEYIKLEIDNGSGTPFYVVTNATGEYKIPLEAGTYTVTPVIENPAYFESTPANFTVTFPNGTGDTITQDFILSQLGDFDDFEIEILPITDARPGARVRYKIIYTNKGTTCFTGDLTFSYDAVVMTYDEATVNPDLIGNPLTWNIENLAPFSSEEIIVDFILNPANDPTDPLSQGDILNLSATLDIPGAPVTATYDHEVINAFDPNDKKCMEGDFLTLDMIGEELTYRIRFENTGNAHALNIVVEDEINPEMFDISTLKVIDASHECKTFIEGNTVKFVFEDIYLHWEDDKNDGYVFFKIKTLDTLKLDDTVENTAEIFFDTNHPIVTNTATSVFGVLNIADQFKDQSISVYPNPAKNQISISADNAIKNIQIFDILGASVLERNMSADQNNTLLSLENLNSGVYLIRVESEKGSYSDKLIIE
ncbi:T9SS type A sorting domain-containing protein [Aureivirga sp. CE67]|uniref:DUF7619 domain-containing protein n=1 Tax=Aureivirga sp. CE67 TaxID=1788983 RepID=UPI0018CB87A3|nr:T9SS type A sorting domain-containing protein [Aureivirga sp. CE67]